MLGILSLARQRGPGGEPGGKEGGWPDRIPDRTAVGIQGWGHSN